MRVIFVRHAIAANPEGEELTDFMLPLTTQGQMEMKLVARRIVEFENNLCAIYTSPRKRTVQTSLILSGEAGSQCPTQQLKELDLCGQNGFKWFFDACKTTKQGACVFVGHEPGLLKLAEKFIHPDSITQPVYFSRGSALCLEFDDAPEYGKGKFVYMIHPGQLIN